MAETVQVDCLAVYGVTAAVVGRGGSARVTCFEDVGFFALAPDVEGLRGAAHFVFFVFLLLRVFSKMIDCSECEKLGWLGVLLIDAGNFRFE